MLYKYVTKQNINFCILFITFLTVSGSLFVSEVLNIQPCPWCWWVRVFMFPLFFIALYITFTKKYDIMNLYAVFASISTIISGIYWYKTQFMPKSFTCQISFNSSGGCLEHAVKIMGFINLPFLGLVASIMILVLVYISTKVKVK